MYSCKSCPTCCTPSCAGCHVDAIFAAIYSLSLSTFVIPLSLFSLFPKTLLVVVVARFVWFLFPSRARTRTPSLSLSLLFFVRKQLLAPRNPIPPPSSSFSSLSRAFRLSIPRVNSKLDACATQRVLDICIDVYIYISRGSVCEANSAEKTTKRENKKNRGG